MLYVPNKKRAIYAGSFDPLTFGHLWVLEVASTLFDEVIMAIGDNPNKKYTFSQNKRIQMAVESVTLKEMDNVFIDVIGNKYLFNYAVQKNANFIVRGVRNSQDFEFERTLQNINSEINSACITTILLAPPKNLSEVSSSVVKALCGPEGWEAVVAKMVPEPVFEALKRMKE